MWALELLVGRDDLSAGIICELVEVLMPPGDSESQCVRATTASLRNEEHGSQLPDSRQPAVDRSARSRGQPSPVAFRMRPT